MSTIGWGCPVVNDAGEFVECECSSDSKLIRFGIPTDPIEGSALLPEPGRDIRAVWAFGHAYAIVKGQNTGNAIVCRDDGLVVTLGPTVGNQCVGIYALPDHIVAVYVTGMLFPVDGKPSYAATSLWPDFSGPSTLLLQQPQVLWPGTSQGFLDLSPDGTPLWTDLSRTKAVDGKSLALWMERKAVYVGQGPDAPAQVAATDGSGWRTVWLGDTAFPPQLAVAPDGRAMVGIASSTAAFVQSPFGPYIGGGSGNGSVIIPEVALFPHAVVISPFKDSTHASGCQWTAEELAAKYRVWFHDGTDEPQPPAGTQIVLVECYRVPEETLLQSGGRWTANVKTSLQTGLIVGVIPMFYTQDRWTVQQTVDAAWVGCDLVRFNPRIQVIAPFEYDRANGITAHSELQELLRRVQKATPGVPAFLSQTAPPIIPPPVIPPTPIYPFQSIKEFAIMTSEIRDCAGPDGKFGRADVVANRIVFDQVSPNDDTKVEITQPDNLYTVRFVKPNKIVNFPGTWGADSSSGGVVRQFELRDPGQRGADESPVVGQYQDGMLVAAVHHVNQQGVAFLSAALTLVKA